MAQPFLQATWKNHLKHLWPGGIYAALPIVVPLYVRKVHGVNDLTFAVLVSLALAGFVIVPHILMHLRYTKISSDVRVQFNQRLAKMIYKKGEHEWQISESEIESVDKVLPRSVARDQMFVYPWQQYGYGIINLRSGDKLRITTLILPQLEIPMNIRNVNVRESLFCWPP